MILVDRKKFGDLLSKHVKVSRNMNRPFIVALKKLKTSVFSNDYTYTNLRDFIQNAISEIQPKIISSLSQFSNLRNSGSQYFVAIL